MVGRSGAVRLAAPALMVVLLAGCRGDEPVEESGATGTPTPDESAAESKTGAESDGTNEESDQPAQPVVVDLDEEQRTPSGTVFRLDRLEVDDLSILVDVEVIVAAEQGNITLNSDIGGTAATVRDDQGNEYPLIPPEDNRNLTLEQGERLEGTLVYQGPLHDGAQALTLHFNDNSDPDGGGLTDRMYPYFEFGPIDITG